MQLLSPRIRVFNKVLITALPYSIQSLFPRDSRNTWHPLRSFPNSISPIFPTPQGKNEDKKLVSCLSKQAGFHHPDKQKRERRKRRGISIGVPLQGRRGGNKGHKTSADTPTDTRRTTKRKQRHEKKSIAARRKKCRCMKERTVLHEKRRE